MAQKESKLNLEMAAQQRRLAHASKRDSTAMKTLSLLGAVFLPGTFLSSVFSMTFFDFGECPASYLRLRGEKGVIVHPSPLPLHSPNNSMHIIYFTEF